MKYTLTNQVLSRLVGRSLTKKDTKLLTSPQPNIIIQLLLGFASHEASLKELISYIEDDPALTKELEASHSVETCLRYYAKKLEAAKYLVIS